MVIKMSEIMKYDFELDLQSENSASKILKMIRSKSVILEFGPANGRMTQYMKEILGCDIYIVELVQSAFETAIQYAQKGVCGDIEELVWLQEFGNIKFDYILFADVLEHLNNPKGVMEKSIQLLKDDGSIIFSVPNIAHNDILLGLHRDDFHYTWTGLLDNSHVHLFAYQDVQALINDCGLSLVNLDAVMCLTGFTERGITVGDYSKEIVNCLKKRNMGEVYQFICQVQKREYVKANKIFCKNQLVQTITVYICYIYFDWGDGFEGNEKIEPVSKVESENLYYVRFKVHAGIKRIRFDPLERHCKVKVLACKTKTTEVVCKAINANYSDNGYDIFLHEDPIYLLDIDVEDTELEIQWKLEFLSKEEIDSFLSKISKDNFELRNRALYCEHAIKLKEETILAKDEEIKQIWEQKDQEIKKIWLEKSEEIEKLQKQHIQLQEQSKRDIAQLQEEKDKEIKKIWEEKDREIKEIWTEKDIEINKISRRNAEIQEQMQKNLDKSLQQLKTAEVENGSLKSFIAKIQATRGWVLLKKIYHLTDYVF